MRLIILFFSLLFSSAALCQSQPEKVQKLIRSRHLKPLHEVDTVSKKLPRNYIVGSGWHIEYYANITFPDALQLNVYKLIYKDTLCHVYSWPTNFEREYYDSLVFVQEDSAFLYLKYADNNNSLEILSTTDDHEFYSLYALVYQDYNQGIYVMSPSGFCGGREIDPFFYVTSLTAHETKEVAFKGKWKQDSSTNSGLQINCNSRDLI